MISLCTAICMLYQVDPCWYEPEIFSCVAGCPTYAVIFEVLSDAITIKAIIDKRASNAWVKQ